MVPPKTKLISYMHIDLGLDFFGAYGLKVKRNLRIWPRVRIFWAV
jgi:hypothetical protein